MENGILFRRIFVIKYLLVVFGSLLIFIKTLLLLLLNGQLLLFLVKINALFVSYFYSKEKQSSKGFFFKTSEVRKMFTWTYCLIVTDCWAFFHFILLTQVRYCRKQMDSKKLFSPPIRFVSVLLSMTTWD